VPDNTIDAPLTPKVNPGGGVGVANAFDTAVDGIYTFETASLT
jgi:hypothetical protein